MIFKLKNIFKRKFQRTKFVTNILKLYYQSESVIKKKRKSAFCKYIHRQLAKLFPITSLANSMQIDGIA